MHWQQTPDTFLPGLRSLPWWDNADVPLTKVLEENQAKLRKDAEKLLKRRRGGWDETYSSLIADGDWQKLSLCTAPLYPVDWSREALSCLPYGVCRWADTGKQWDPKLCKVAKFTCGLLEAHMHPDVAQVAGNQEEVVFFLTQPGSVVALHNGGSNTRLNVHIGLLNLEGSYIEVANKRREWSTTESFVFDDGYDHAVYTPEAEQGSEAGPRVVLAVGISHPDLEPDSGAQIEESWRKEL